MATVSEAGFLFAAARIPVAVRLAVELRQVRRHIHLLCLPALFFDWARWRRNELLEELFILQALIAAQGKAVRS